MHDIEPYYKWRDDYIASEDESSPFFGTVNDEFYFTKRIYNYLIHPQWDEIGSPTLFIKVLYADYDNAFAIIELLGEWNDCVENDIMYLKRNIIDKMLNKGIHKYILLCDNLLVFHAGDEDYYEEWIEDIDEDHGWICLLNTNDPVYSELKSYRRSNYLSFGGELNEINWRLYKPRPLYKLIDGMLNTNAQIPARF